MREYLTLIIGGIADGSVVALAALGLVLTYKASGIFNFAQGAIGAVAAGLFYQLYALNHWPAVAAMVVTLLVAGIGLGLVMERVAYFVSAASTTMKVVATVGIMITLTALFTLKFGGVVQLYPSFLPQSSFSLGGVNISYANLIIIVIGIAAAAGLSVFFRRATMGRAMRAVVDDPVLVGLLGISPARVRRWAWMIGTTFAAVAGVLIAPSLGLDGTSLTVLVITSFGAVAIGGFASLPLTYVGAIVIQVLVAVATKWASGHQELGWLPATLPFIILFVVLLATPKRRLVEVGASLQQRISYLPRPSWKGATLRLAPVVVILILLPHIVGSYLLDWTIGLVYVILMMSLSLLVRTANQISLCQLSFAAVGAIAAYHLSALGYPWPVAVLGAGIAAVPVGAVVALAAVRFSGVFLALATLAFGVVLETAVYQTFLMFGGSVIPLPTPRPSFAQSDNAYYYVVLVVVGICYLIVRLIERSRLGQLLRSKADAPQALEALGVSNSVLQAVVFCVGAFLAGIAGSLIGPIFGVVGETDFQTIPTSIMLVALLILGARNPRIGTLGAAIGGAIGLVVIPQYISSNTVLSCLDLLFGVAAVEAALASTRPFRPGSRKSWAIPGLGRLGLSAGAAGGPCAGWGGASGRFPGRGAHPGGGAIMTELQGLRIRDLTVRYGGILAVDKVDLDVPAGMITGLIGPNRAGKSSLFSACSGEVPAHGSVVLFGRDISHMSPVRRARAGIGRTFQRIQLFRTLTVRENVSMGHEAAYVRKNPWSLVHALPSERRETNRVTDEVLDHCGLSDIQERVAGSLSTGQQRMVELARALASPAQMLLLDEPSSGLSTQEGVRFAEILREATTTSGRGILLVEHDMDLVTAVCETVHVLNFGRLIFGGSTADALRSEEVRQSYLGAAGDADGQDAPQRDGADA